jgi:hypothetical protein
VIGLLAAGERGTIRDPWLFLLTSALAIQQHESWLMMRAPARIKATDALQIVAQVPSRCVRMPPFEEG